MRGICGSWDKQKANPQRVGKTVNFTAAYKALVRWSKMGTLNYQLLCFYHECVLTLTNVFHVSLTNI